jgi:hypothetical protein
VANHSFLPKSTDVLRTMIEGVLESYENPWDLLAELAQNSMDAIRAGDTPKGDLVVHIDQKKRTIEWSDNGCGIDPADIDDLFVMYGTNKRGNPEMIGEKGVGIKFVIFSSSKFELTSHHASGSFEMTVSGAADWLDNSDADDISFQTAPIKNSEGQSGVRIKITVADKDDPIFGLDLKQLENLLRTKTAVGSTKHIWEAKDQSDLSLSVKFSSGKLASSIFECQFILPIKDAKKSLSLDAYREWAADGTKSDDQKRRKLKDALLFHAGKDSNRSRNTILVLHGA